MWTRPFAAIRNRRVATTRSHVPALRTRTTGRSTSSPGLRSRIMAQYHVPLIIRGRIIDHADVEFGGRRGGASFTTPDVKKHVDAIPLGTPSCLSDLYELNFVDILDYLGELHQRMAFGRNSYLQEAFELALSTSGFTAPLQRAELHAREYRQPRRHPLPGRRDPEAHET